MTPEEIKPGDRVLFEGQVVGLYDEGETARLQVVTTRGIQTLYVFAEHVRPLPDGGPRS